MGIEDRKQREFERREKDILEAAFDLFAEKGVENVTIEMIAEAAEIGKGTIYKHFKSKHEIFASLVLGRGKEVHALVKEIDPELPVVEKLKHTFYLYADLFFKDKKALNVFNKCEAMLTPDGLSDSFIKEIETLHEMKSSQITALFKEGIDKGIFIDADPSILTMIVTGLFSGTMQQLIDMPTENPLDVVMTLEKVLLNGILKH